MVRYVNSYMLLLKLFDVVCSVFMFSLQNSKYFLCLRLNDKILCLLPATLDWKLIKDNFLNVILHHGECDV